MRIWNCRRCGRENHTEIRPNGTVTCEHCGDVKRIQPARSRGGETSTQVSDVLAHGGELIEAPVSRPRDDPSRDDFERRDAFVRLQQTYVKAQKLMPEEGTYEELQWILGSRRNGTQDPPPLGMRTIELIGLWLEDLVREMERRSSTRGEAARQLRDAAAGFLLAFRREPANPLEAAGPAPLVSVLPR